MSTEKSYRSDIDGLRAIAVMVVIAFHARFPGFRGGFVGVDVFFVISGFLITGLLIKEILQSGRLNLLNFYARRARRLFPALALTIAGTLALWAIFMLGGPEETAAFASSVKYSVFALANVFFEHNSGGYFHYASDEMPLLHFWSLAVEEQFYFVWPFLLLVSCLGLPKNNSANPKKRERMLIMLAVISALAFIGSAVAMSADSTWRSSAFYSMPLRAWELGIGGLLCFALPYFSRLTETRQRNFAGSFSLLGLALIFFSVFFYSAHNSFPGPNALFPTVGTALLIVAGGLSRPSWIQKILSHRVLCYLGLMSYGWYLWHWPLLAMGKAWYLGEIPPLYFRIGAIILSLLLAQLSYRYVESPIRFGKRMNKISPARILLATLLGSAVLAIVAHVLPIYEAQKLAKTQNPALRKLLESMRDRDLKDYHWVRCTSTLGDEACLASFSPPGTQSPVHLSVWGDSHSRSHFPMIWDLAKERQLSASLYYHAGYPALLPVDGFYVRDRENTQKMNEANAGVIASLKAKISSAPTVKQSLLLVSRWTLYTGGDPIAVSLRDGTFYLDEAKSRAGSLAILERSLRKTLSELQSAGVFRVMVMLPYPEFKYMALHCAQRRPEACQVTRARLEDYVQAERAILEKVAGEFDFVRVINPIPFFCEADLCRQIVERDGELMPVVQDDSHPSKAASEYLGRQIKSELEWLVGEK